MKEWSDNCLPATLLGLRPSLTAFVRPRTQVGRGHGPGPPTDPRHHAHAAGPAPQCLVRLSPVGPIWAIQSLCCSLLTGCAFGTLQSTSADAYGIPAPAACPCASPSASLTRYVRVRGDSLGAVNGTVALQGTDGARFDDFFEQPQLAALPTVPEWTTCAAKAALATPGPGASQQGPRPVVRGASEGSAASAVAQDAAREPAALPPQPLPPPPRRRLLQQTGCAAGVPSECPYALTGLYSWFSASAAAIAGSPSAVVKDMSGNNRDGEVSSNAGFSPTVLTDGPGANGINASCPNAGISYVTGTTATALTLGQLPATFSYCVVSRYTSTTGQGRIVASSAANVLLGHFNGLAGVSSWNGNFATPRAQPVYIFNNQNWLLQCARALVLHRHPVVLARMPECPLCPVVPRCALLCTQRLRP